MAIDMSQFYQVFFEEASEHLVNMESLLLALDVESPDAEELNAVFRAAHSIKGSAGTFGFTDLAEVTHILENLLDRIRKGEMALRNDMIDAFLAAGDVLKELLAAHRCEGEADPALVGDICQRLRDLTSGAAAPSSASPATAVESVAIPAPPVVEKSVERSAGYRLGFNLEPGSPDPFALGENLLAELAVLGDLTVLSRPAESEPGGAWTAELRTQASEGEIQSILDFVVRTDTLSIAALDLPIPSDDADGAFGFFTDDSPTAGLPSSDEAYGFFDDAFSPSLSPAPADDSDGAYGFFEAPTPETATVEGSTTQNDDVTGAYGFFEPLPSAPSAPVVVEDDPTGAFGFFEPLLPPAPSSPEPVVAPPPASTTARENGARTKPPAPADTTIRVGVEKVDQLINLIGELVITQAMLAQSASVLDPVQFERLHNGLSQLERNTRDLQESVMSIRMMPISTVFSRFPRVVRDLSQKLGKRVELKTIGEGTELDKGLIERIADPLTHLVRNSLDHGVEMPDVRTAKGNPATGTITLKAYHQSGHIVIEVSDDGAGLNRQKILSKAQERGLPAHEGMSDHEVWQLIFEAGFSTAEQITEVSGRGVGMDVVKRNISEMGGRVEIDSMTGVGTRMTVRLPLTLAILDGMSVAAGADTYIIPLGYVKESLQATAAMIKSVSGFDRLIQVRDEYLPIVVLHEMFRIPNAVQEMDKGIMVVLEVDGSKAALFVDALVGQHQVVIKSLEANYRRVAGISGATIMGDGHVALILDVAALVQMARTAQPAAA